MPCIVLNHSVESVWVDDNYEFKSCPLCVDGTGDFDQEDYVSEWTDWEGVDMNLF